MQLISPDILIEARGLSPGASGFLLLVGMFLWGFGWRWHRFWIVFGITLAAGLIGLSAGRAAGGQVLAVGVLLALSAGMLALELARIFAFITGGTAAWIASSSIIPSGQELCVVFLCGGLLGVVLYRLWTMLATSFMGLVLCWHTLLVMAESFIKFDAAQFVLENMLAINSAVIAATLLGILVQSWTGNDESAEAEKPDLSSDGHEKNHKKRPGLNPFGILRRLWKFSGR